MLDSFKVLLAAINVGVFPGEVEAKAKDLVKALDNQLSDEGFEDDNQRVEIEQLDAALNEAALAVDEEEEEEIEEEEEV